MPKDHGPKDRCLFVCRAIILQEGEVTRTGGGFHVIACDDPWQAYLSVTHTHAYTIARKEQYGHNGNKSHHR